MGDTTDLEYRVHDARMDITLGSSKSAFRLEIIGPDDPFQNDFSRSRDFEIDGLTPDERNRFSRQSSGNCNLIDTIGYLLHGGVREHRRAADHERGFEVLSFRYSLSPVNIQLLIRLRS